MFRISWALASSLALAVLLTAGAERGAAQYFVPAPVATACYAPAFAPAPAVSYYYAPAAPAVSYYAPQAPAVSYYYAPAPAVSYYAPTTSYYAAPAVSYYAAPVVYPGAAVTTNYRYGLFGLRRGAVTTYYPPYVGY